MGTVLDGVISSTFRNALFAVALLLDTSDGSATVGQDPP
jgi:hypothetical protein